MERKRDVIIISITAIIYCVGALVEGFHHQWYLPYSNLNVLAALGLIWWCRTTRFFTKGLDEPIKKVITVISCVIFLCLTVYSVIVKLQMKNVHVITVIATALLWVLMAAVVGLEPKKDQEEK